MATKKGKKGKKKVTKKPKATAKKRIAAARPKRSAGRRPAKTAALKRSARKASSGKAAPKKSAQKKPRASARTKKPAPTPKAKTLQPIRREDRPGHLDPRYAAKLRAQSGSLNEEHDPNAFIDSPRGVKDDLAEELGEEVIAKATSGEDDGQDGLDQVVPEEQGGPFVETNAAQEFAQGTDESNPRGAKREPFPTT
ncbi:MAG: hypothetical protein M3O46_15005 [Myxococcota bacterium]|nr:hypothetical protein [Myxococcota bacterium]